MFDQREPIDLPLEAPPHLIVVVDTEEEFDWQAEPDPDASRVTAMGPDRPGTEHFPGIRHLPVLRD